MKYVLTIPVLWIALHAGVIVAPIAALPILILPAFKKVWIGFALAFFGISLGYVYLESGWLYRRGYPETPKTAVVTTHGGSAVKVNEIFPMVIEAYDLTVPINAMQADLTFNPTYLAVRGISVTDSFADVFTTKSYDNVKGTLVVTGGLPNPGVSQKQVTFATVYFQALQSGETTVTFAPTSMVLANDGRGTNVVARLTPQSYVIDGTLAPADLQKQSQKYTDTYFAADHGKDQHLFLPPTNGASPSEIHQLTTPQANNRLLQDLAHIDDFLLRFWPSLIHRQ